jgi:uncharacterized protein
LALYLDTSVLVSAFVPDARTDEVVAWLASVEDRILVSDWAQAEFSSALGVMRRTDRLDREPREALERAFDRWLVRTERIETFAADFELARRLMREERVALKTPDALHLAAAIRWQATLATTDRQLVSAATDVGLAVEPI